MKHNDRVRFIFFGLAWVVVIGAITIWLAGQR